MVMTELLVAGQRCSYVQLILNVTWAMDHFEWPIDTSALSCVRTVALSPRTDGVGEAPS